MKKCVFFTTSIFFFTPLSAHAECCVFGDAGDGVNSIFISISSYDWLGTTGSGFLNSANWEFGDLFNAPTGSGSAAYLPVQFRPQAWYVNGFFVRYIVPVNGGAVLSSDYTSNSYLRLSSGVGANLTITNGATYTLSNAYIGHNPTNNYLVDHPGAADTAILSLNNGHIIGAVTLGVDASGELNVAGTSSITGNLLIAQNAGSYGTLNIASGAQWTLNRNLITFGAGTAIINNEGTIDLNPC